MSDIQCRLLSSSRSSISIAFWGIVGTVFVFGFNSLSAESIEEEPKFGLRRMVVGGIEVPNGHYSWMCAFVRAEDKIPYRGFIGAGCLIHPEWVLTAAHVVESFIGNDLEVIIGGGNLLTSQREDRVGIESIRVNPGFKGRDGQLGSDLALVKLKRAVTGRGTISLAPRSLRISAMGMVRALGWGRTSTQGFVSPSLRSVDLPLVDGRDVDSEEIYGESLPEDVILAGFSEGGADTCEGDSGGPLLIFDSPRQIWRLLGVVSAGPQIGCASAGTFGLYNSLAPHLPWLESLVVKSYGDWEGLYPVGNPEGDADSDGYSNWDEYARASDPENARSRPWMRNRIVNEEGFRFWEIVGFARTGVEDVEFLWESSSNLASWKSVSNILKGESSPGREVTELRFRFRFPWDERETTSGFLRLLPVPLSRKSLDASDQDWEVIESATRS